MSNVQRLLLGVAAALALSFGVGGGVRADAPEPVGQSFHVEVVMVVGNTPETAEHGPDWGFADGVPATSLSWPERLALLKTRGTTTLLLDGHTTAMDGVPTEITRNVARFERLYDRSDVNNEFFKASTFNEGVTVKLRANDAYLEYEAAVNWLLPAQDAGRPPFQGTWRVKGSIPHGVGPTLVFSHREQVAEPGHAPQDVEIYAFLTPSPVSR